MNFRGEWVEWNLGEEDRPSAPLRPPDVIYHLAAQTSAYQARAALEMDLRVNVLGFASVLLAALEIGSSPFVVAAGAATETGRVSHLPLSDMHAQDPQTFYDVAKVTQGLYLSQFQREGWLEGCRLRFANVYGGGPASASDRGFLNRAISSALAGKPMTFFDDGLYVRDYLHVNDAVSALMSAASRRHLTSGDTFIIGTGIGTPIRDVLTLVSQIVFECRGLRAPVIAISPKNGIYDIERRDAVVDSGRFTLRTGWTPSITLEEGIRMAVDGS